MTRLIDADEFINEMKYMCHRFGMGEYDRHLSLNDIKINIAMMHTVDSVKHGRWIDDTGEGYYANCSVCGYQMDVHHERGYFNYCPNCGAKMDEVGDGHN